MVKLFIIHYFISEKQVHQKQVLTNYDNIKRPSHLSTSLHGTPRIAA